MKTETQDRTLPLGWERLTRDEVGRALRLAVRLAYMTNDERFETVWDIGSGKTSRQPTERLVRLEQAMRDLGVPPRRLETRVERKRSVIAKYRVMLRDNPDNAGLRKWVRSWLRRWFSK